MERRKQAGYRCSSPIGPIPSQTTTLLYHRSRRRSTWLCHGYGPPAHSVSLPFLLASFLCLCLNPSPTPPLFLVVYLDQRRHTPIVATCRCPKAVIRLIGRVCCNKPRSSPSSR